MSKRDTIFMSPWRLESKLQALFVQEVENAKMTKNASLEEAVALWLVARGVEGVEMPEGCSLARLKSKPKVDPAEEEARKAAEAQKAKEFTWKLRKEFNDRFRAAGTLPPWGFFRPENQEEEDAFERAEEEARKREQAEKEAFV